MVNFTITLPEDLKAEMDKYPEVNWSEVFRKSAQTYIQTRQNPTPQLDFEIKEAFVDWDWLVAKPRVTIHVKATNGMPADIVVDRIYFAAGLESVQGGRSVGGFTGYLLDTRPMKAGESTLFSLYTYPSPTRLRRLADKLTETFLLELNLRVVVQGFPNLLNKEVKGKVPVDEWKKGVASALSSYNEHWLPKGKKVDRGNGKVA